MGNVPPSNAPAASVALFGELCDRYQAPGRYYHTLEHVVECLDHLAWWDHETGESTPCVVSLAVWYHDLVYDPRRSDNEARSAERAHDVALELGWSTGEAAAVRRLVMATAHLPSAGLSQSRSDRAASQSGPWSDLVHDVDLVILGAPRARYQRYRADVRSEYSHVPDELYTAGRGKILRDFRSRSSIYRLPPFERVFGREARANIDWELTFHGAG